MPNTRLKIASLLPSATDILKFLQLDEYLVAITHECVVENSRHSTMATTTAVVVTSDGVNSADNSQGAIHDQVARNYLARASDPEAIPSLYPVDYGKLRQALDIFDEDDEDAKGSESNDNNDDNKRDNECRRIIFTQDLCQVCAPSYQELLKVFGNNNTSVSIVSLTPHTLEDVADNITKVAQVCGRHTPSAISQSRADFLQHFQDLNAVVELNRDESIPKPRIMLLEWLDPPFDGGHWIPELIHWAGCESANQKAAGDKSKSITWEQVLETRNAYSDIVAVVACCGFDLERNIRDAETIAIPKFAKEGTSSSGSLRIVASDGDEYFSKPGPQLIQGAIILALAGYANQPAVVEAVSKLPFVDARVFESFKELDLSSAGTATPCLDEQPIVNDIEDFDQVHSEACRQGKMSYTDPETGYMVMTELNHRKRGKCCGSGCRHCPYHHENVRPGSKSSKIQQPAILVNPTTGPLVVRPGKITVLFNSGGKDSFLTLRALVREAINKARETKEPPYFGVVLLTTFDATSRQVAHQEVAIDDVVRQAEHLGITLIGVPLPRHASQEDKYVNRIQKGLEALERHFEKNSLDCTIESLAFGDLHLEHILEWRQSQLSSWGYKLLYPLLKVPYPELMEDLVSSQVPCVVSASTVDCVSAGESFGPEWSARLPIEIDRFGENGEFHTLARVWEVDRNIALGMDDLSSETAWLKLL